MSDASEADRQEQEQPVGPPVEPEPPHLDPEVPEADAVEQAQPAPLDDDEFR